MSDAAWLIVWTAAFLVAGGVLAWPVGRYIETHCPALGTASFIVLGIIVLFVSWAAATHVTGSTQMGCTEVLDEMEGPPGDARADLLARCVATAGQDEIEPAVVMRRHPKLYPFTLR